MNVRQRIADAVGGLIEALGAVGPSDGLWGGLDPLLDVYDRDRLTAPGPPPDNDPKQPRAAA